jgi:hypothetical protein
MGLDPAPSDAAPPPNPEEYPMPVISLKSLALMTVVTALLVPAAASAQSLSTSGTPNYGARTIAPGFTPDPIQIAVTSGGTLNVSAMNLGSDCTGYATAQPDFNFTLSGTSSFLRVFVDAGNEDTTLIINKANGQWACNDDSNGGRNPMVDMTNAGPGLYNVWIGSYQSGTRARGTLNITELHNRFPGGGSGTPTPAPSSGRGGALSTSGTPNFGARTITPGFTPDPIRIPVVSGGSIDISAQNLGTGCTGFATAQPDFNFTLAGTSAFLRVYVDAVANNKDTTLVINTANGQWICNDDSFGGTNPSIDLSNAGPGLYNVWIGSYETGVQAHGRLNVTELQGNHP